MSWKYLFKQKVWPLRKSRYWLAPIFTKLWAHLLQEQLTCWLTCRLLHAPSLKNVILKANYKQIYKRECNVLLLFFSNFANLKPWTIRSNDTELSSRATGSVLDFWHTGQICQLCECMWMCVYLFLLLYTHCSSVQHFLEVTCYLWSVGAMRSEPQQVKLFSLSVTSVTVPTPYTSALSTSCQTSVLITA